MGVPLRVCIFLWQASLDCLPSASNLQKRQGPGNGCCAFCASREDANHILFQCAPAKFLWSCVRDSFGASWVLNSMSEQLALLVSRDQQCRLALPSFVALAWDLWSTRNKIAIEGNLPAHPANYIFKWPLFFQSCASRKRKDDEATCGVLLEIKRLHTLHRSDSSWSLVVIPDVFFNFGLRLFWVVFVPFQPQWWLQFF